MDFLIQVKDCVVSAQLHTCMPLNPGLELGEGEDIQTYRQPSRISKLVVDVQLFIGLSGQNTFFNGDWE